VSVSRELPDINQELESGADAFIKYLKWIFGVAVLIIVVVSSVYFIKFNDGFSDKPEVWGTFGDFIGGTLNPILSFLSLIALLLTIVLQQKELESSRKELGYTRTELERSANAQIATQKILDEQSDTMIRQQFESTFFSLLDQHNKTLENLLNNQYFDEVNWSIHGQSANLDEAKHAIQKAQHILGSYYKVLYQLLKFIATNCPDSDVGNTFVAKNIQKTPVSNSEQMYSNIIRSFIGLKATQLLAVNCYCKSESDSYWKYKLLVERYALLEHMSFKMGKNIIKSFHELPDVYNKSAFGNSDYLRDELGR